ncbi:MAG: serine/threonine-protein phosphatase [Bacteroidales bacterium]|nr:serine/threonine-protein phosphatase [Bacteroidales bacterium]MCF8337756.1 serine/threonine-protein phosphatase [Bacteroidales bacterium]
MTSNEFPYIEVKHESKNHEGERICGDVFLSRRIKEEKRTIVVLSDGLGHGVKANILATLTAKMALNFTQEHKDIERIAEIIMNTLPIDSERKISYATFSIVDIEEDDKTRILEFDNPETLILRGDKLVDIQWEYITLKTEKHKDKQLRSYSFYPRQEDRIVMTSDGITQSGLGMGTYPFGWGEDNLKTFVQQLVSNEPDMSAELLARKVVNMAHKNDQYKAKDDTSCAVIYFRRPRRLLLCTGPPYEKDKDPKLASEVSNFDGKIVISGATTADIISRELDKKITDSFEFHDPDLPPISYMDGIDLVTEGILTLSKVTDILKNYSNKTDLGKGPADSIVKLLLESDEIHLIIGTRINIAHQDPNLPVDLEIRRTVVKRIAALLEENFLKEVKIRYI